jgi:hypothetical protein
MRLLICLEYLDSSGKCYASRGPCYAKSVHEASFTRLKARMTLILVTCRVKWLPIRCDLSPSRSATSALVAPFRIVFHRVNEGRHAISANAKNLLLYVLFWIKPCNFFAVSDGVALVAGGVAGVRRRQQGTAARWRRRAFQTFLRALRILQLFNLYLGIA